MATDPEVPYSIPGIVRTTEALLGRNSNSSGLENREYDRMDSLRLPRDTFLSTKFGTNFVDNRRSLGRYS
jgi:hypothetical protein